MAEIDPKLIRELQDIELSIETAIKRLRLVKKSLKEATKTKISRTTAGMTTTKRRGKGEKNFKCFRCELDGHKARFCHAVMAPKIKAIKTEEPIGNWGDTPSPSDDDTVCNQPTPTECV